MLYAKGNFVDTPPEKSGDFTIQEYLLDEIIVTAKLSGTETVMEVPEDIIILTAEEIERSQSSSLIELLSTEANLNIKSLNGNGKNAVVDIRGMGDSAVSNVIVLVDGMRLNSPDMSAPDWASVPLEQIERVEIIRGAASVLYGNGAVGGAINIITKKGSGPPKLTLRTSAGSFGTFDQRVSAQAQKNGLRTYLSGSFFHSDGYRKNSQLEKKDFGARFEYEVNSNINLGIFTNIHEDRYGLPGPVGLADSRSADKRRQSLYPDDQGETSDFRIGSSLAVNMDKYGQISLEISGRKRSNAYILGYNPLLSDGDQTDVIKDDEVQLSAIYDLDYSLFGREHSLKSGFDYFHSDYVRTENSQSTRKNSRINQYGLYLNNSFSLGDGLKFIAGARHNIWEGTFRTDEEKSFAGGYYWQNGELEHKQWQDDVFNLALNYFIFEQTSVFLNFSTSFRVPNVDEFAQADEELKPQKGQQMEAGIKSIPNEFMEFAFTAYQLRIQDEIYYGEDPITLASLNRNYDEPTKRTGIDLQARFFPAKNLMFKLNYSWIDAHFSGSNNFIPLVPKNKISAQSRWQICKDFNWSITGLWSDSMYDGNDLSNDRYSKIPSWTVFNTKVEYKYRQIKFFAGIDNIFDEFYSTTAYSEQYYPMPGRSFYVGLEWKL